MITYSTPRVRFQREEKKEKKRRGRCYAFSEPAQNAQNVAQVTQHEDIKSEIKLMSIFVFKPTSSDSQTN